VQAAVSAETNETELMRALHDEHAAVLWSYALHLTGGDRSRAEDAVQETLLRAWRHPEVLDQSARSARGWLLTVARNVVIDDYRARKARPEVVYDRVPEGAVADRSDEVLQSWLVAEALGRLSQAHREVLFECYYAGRSVAQAAKVLGIPEGTVKSRLHYAMGTLRLILAESGVGE
jgi:RNA polymerase sigma-70 factor, ECF subfamily